MVQVDKQELVNVMVQNEQLFKACCNDPAFRAIYEVLLNNDCITEKALLEMIRCVCEQNNNLQAKLSEAMPQKLPMSASDRDALPTSTELLPRYRAALKIAQARKELRCHVLDIEAKIEQLESGTYKPTALDTVWVDYFLKKNIGKDADSKQWEVFVDRVRSLLNSWDRFHLLHLEVNELEVIHHCLSEINGEFIQSMLKK